LLATAPVVLIPLVVFGLGVRARCASGSPSSIACVAALVD
jgi:hypothetical protein